MKRRPLPTPPAKPGRFALHKGDRCRWCDEPLVPLRGVLFCLVCDRTHEMTTPPRVDPPQEGQPA